MLSRRLFVDRICDEVALSQEALAELSNLDGNLPSSRFLAELAGGGQVNLATRVLYESLLRDPHHGDFIRQVDASPLRARRVSSAPLIVIVPGMFYREYPEIGADGGLLTEVASQFGVDTVTIPTLSLGSVNENVEILHRHLGDIGDRPFWLVSMSRGSAEVKWLLQAHPEATYLDQIKGWVSMCGIVSGTPLHERIYANQFLGAMHRLVARVNGINPELGAELCASNSRWQPTRCPTDTRVVNIIAVPLSWHVTGSVIRRYHRICHHGPTDGVVILSDYLKEPGVIYPVWGVDHFMRTSRITALFYRLFYYLFVGKGENDENNDDRNSGIDANDPDRDSAGSARR